MLHHPVSRYAKQKCSQLAALGLILLRLANQHQKYFLNHFFRRPRRTGHAQRVTIKRRLVLLVQQREMPARRPLPHA